jgi:anti-sigma factor RsiW
MMSRTLKEPSRRVRAGQQFKQRVIDALDQDTGVIAVLDGAGVSAGHGSAGASAGDGGTSEPTSPRVHDTFLSHAKTIPWRAFLSPSPAWAALAMVLVLVSGYNYLRTLGYFAPTGEVPIDMAGVVDDVSHDAYLYSRNQQTLEVLTDSPADVREWFSTRLNFPVDAPANLPGGYTMEGVRLWHTVSRLAALVSYETPDGDWIMLFEVSAENVADHGGRMVYGAERHYHAGESYQYTAIAWQDGGVTYALVADLDPERLVEIADSFGP